MDWNETQKHEADYWGNCMGLRAWGEFAKQEMYAREMRLWDDFGDNGELLMQGRSVLDVGGGPVSMTLRCVGATRLVVVDPCVWPASVHRRYQKYGIHFVRKPCEELDTVFTDGDQFDEVWIYNVLQHVQDPEKIVRNALNRLDPVGGRLRIFEWCYIPADECHPHVLTPDGLMNWLAGARIEQVRIPRLKEFWSDATAFCGVFRI